MKSHKGRLLHSMPPHNFPGKEEQDYESAKYVIIPVPFDSTTYYGPNARNGPHAVIRASRQLPLYDWESKSVPVEKGVFCTAELEPVRGDARLTIERLRQVCEEIVDDGKKPVILGGEHSLSLAGVRAAKPDSVLVLDAHADAWDEFEGSKWSHACVSRRIHEETGGAVSVAGVRSISEEESEYSKKKGFNVFYANKSTVGSVLKSLKGRVYVSVDVDVFDSSLMPSTGTPEPGGLGWEQVCSLLKAVSRKNVVGFDLTELAPIPGLEAPNYAAAKLLYKMVGWF